MLVRSGEELFESSSDSHQPMLKQACKLKFAIEQHFVLDAELVLEAVAGWKQTLHRSEIDVPAVMIIVSIVHLSGRSSG